MEKIRLSKRLLKVAEYVRTNEKIADIGSDHAYLAIYLIQNNIVPYAIAGEIVEGPYNNAKQQVIDYQLNHAIDVRLDNGLEVLQPDENIGTVFICGMGGQLITDILQQGALNNKLSKKSRLVLQPNNNESALRRFLMDQSYTIIDEDILEENEKIYEIIVAEYSNNKQEYSELELLFGPKLIQNRSQTFLKKWQQELDKSQRILLDLERSNDKRKINYFIQYINLIKKVIS